jgi:hypothetical protein
VRAVKEERGGGERVELPVQVVEPGQDRAATGAPGLAQPRLVESPARRGIEVVDDLCVAGGRRRAPAAILKDAQEETRAAPAGELPGIHAESEIEVLDSLGTPGKSAMRHRDAVQGVAEFEGEAALFESSTQSGLAV